MQLKNIIAKQKKIVGVLNEKMCKKKSKSKYLYLYMNQVYLAPSFYAHILNGILLLFAFIILYKNYSKIRNIEPYKLIILILFFSVSVGIHGLSHLGMEQKYNFNPVTLIIK